MRSRADLFAFILVFTLVMGGGCDSDGGEGSEPGDFCAMTSCFDHATCQPASLSCACDSGYENWTDGVGCTPEPLALVGSYADPFGGHHEISPSLWTQSGFGNPSYFHVTHFSNADQVVIAQANGHNAWNAGLWSRFDWTWFDAGDGRALWFCQGTLDAASEADALAATPADATDPATSGCGGFGWSKVVPADPAHLLAGDWQDNWATGHAITADSWVQTIEGSPDDTYRFTLGQFSNAAAWIVGQNDADNPTNAGLWSRFDWTWFDAGDGLELWYCQSTYDAATEEDALAATAPDASDPTTGGCGAAPGYPWSKLLPFVAETVE